MLNDIIFIAGPHGVGKTYVTTEIKKRLDILHFDLGPMIRSIHKKLSPEKSFKEWIVDGEREQGVDFSNLVLANEIDQNLPKDNLPIIITGSRSARGMQYLADHFLIKNPFVIYLDADKSLLKHNYETREHISLTNEQFNDLLFDEQQMGLLQIKEYVMAHPNNTLYLINRNNSSGLIAQIQNIIQNRHTICTHKSKINLTKGNPHDYE